MDKEEPKRWVLIETNQPYYVPTHDVTVFTNLNEAYKQYEASTAEIKTLATVNESTMEIPA